MATRDADREMPLVLIGEDDPMFRSLLRTALEQADFDVIEAEDGAVAARRFQEKIPDIVLLDVMMPWKDGFTVCKEIRGSEAGKDVPIVLITGMDDDDALEHALERGATGLISKPIDWASVGGQVRKFLESAA